MLRTDNGAGFTARVTTSFRGVRDGEVHPRLWQPGDEISGDLAREAVRGGQARQIGVTLETKEADPVPGNPQTGRTGAGASSSSQPPARTSKGKTSRKRAADAR
jgi:hypothetical protein